MSATAPPATRSRIGRWLLAGAAALGLLVLVTVLTPDDARFDAELDPRNPGRHGAEALARVLDDHGVEVLIVRGESALLGADIRAGTTVVVTNPGELGASTLHRLEDHATAATAQVYVGDARILGDLFDREVTGATQTGPRPASCDEELARGLVLRSYSARQLQEDGCFGAKQGSLLVRRDRTWLMTSPESLTNARVLGGGNGALALRLLGQGSRVVWYVADGSDVAASDGVGLGHLLPPWLSPALFVSGAALLALLLVRGRRLGPLVTEPLPVAVRAVESTRSRGRIYQKTRDRQHAASVLARASRRRLAAELRLARDVSLPPLAVAVAARTGRDPHSVHALLGEPVVTTDTQLVELGRQLIELENEVHGR